MKNLFAKPFVLTSFYLITSILLGLSPLVPTSVLSGVWLTTIITITVLIFVLALISLIYRTHRLHGKLSPLFSFLYMEGILLFSATYFLISYVSNIESIHLGLAAINPEILSVTPYSVFISFTESVYFSLLATTTMAFNQGASLTFSLILLMSMQVLLFIYTTVVGIRLIFKNMANKKRVVENESQKTGLKIVNHDQLAKHEFLPKHEQTFIFIRRLIGLFVELHRQSVEDNGTHNISSLLTKEQMKLIYQGLDLNAQSSLNPELNWWLYLAEESQAICECGETILREFEGDLENELYKYVQQLSCSVELSTMGKLPTLKDLPVRKNITPVLGSNCLVPRQAFLSNAISLYNWCIELQKQHVSVHESMDELFVYHLNTEREHPPRSFYQTANELSNQALTMES